MKSLNENEVIFIPLDFNSLSNSENQKLKLSNYYIDYAFYSENLKPLDEMHVVLYDKFWTKNFNEIICLDGTLKENKNEKDPWSVILNGKIYTYNQVPHRKYFSSFIGADTSVIEDLEPNEQKKNRDFKNDKLANINCFIFAPDSEIPDFSKIVGVDSKEINSFFKFSNIKTKPLTYRPEGGLTDDTLVVRGGGNKNEVN